MHGIVHAVQGEGAAGADDSVITAIQKPGNSGSGLRVELILICVQQHLCAGDAVGVVHASVGVAAELRAVFGGEPDGQV